MKIATFLLRDEAAPSRDDPWRARPRLGVVTDDGMLDVAAAARIMGATHLDVDGATFHREAHTLLDGLIDLVARADGPILDSNEVISGAAVPRPSKILCAGLNYRRHAEEAGAAIPDEPILFSKFENTLVGHDAEVRLRGMGHVDYEAELAVVIGAPARNVATTNALDYVLGYVNANDVSERDLQMRTSQWLLGKTEDGFLPLGPYLVTRDEVEDPQALSIRGWLGDELRQDSSTADMIFSVAELISYASHHMTLWPGDVLLTGTPEGVILGRSPRDWIVPGQRYEVEIGPLGRLVTRFLA